MPPAPGCPRTGTPSPEVTGSFCLVPSTSFSQAPWYALPVHLCRFRVRSIRWSYFLDPLHRPPNPIRVNNNREVVTSSRPKNINLVPIDYGFRPRLRGRLTLRGLALRRNPWTFGDSVSHTVCRYSCQHSHFRYLQALSRVPFTGLRNAPLPLRGQMTEVRYCAINLATSLTSPDGHRANVATSVRRYSQDPNNSGSTLSSRPKTRETSPKIGETQLSITPAWQNLRRYSRKQTCLRVAPGPLVNVDQSLETPSSIDVSPVKADKIAEKLPSSQTKSAFCPLTSVNCPLNPQLRLVA